MDGMRRSIRRQSTDGSRHGRTYIHTPPLHTCVSPSHSAYSASTTTTVAPLLQAGSMESLSVRGYLFGVILLGVLSVEVRARCVWGDVRYPPYREICPFPACGKCRCIPDGADSFKWSCPENLACEKRPVVLECSYKGGQVTAGQSVLHANGCNNCTCNVGGEFTCKTIPCPPGSAPLPPPHSGSPPGAPPAPPGHSPSTSVCYFKGKVVPVGTEFFPDTRRVCRRCSCVSPARVQCVDHCPKCVYNGTELSVGTRVPSVDGCNTCICGEEARVSCTERFCGPTRCLYKGRAYSIGDVFQKTLGDCNMCDCGIDGLVECRNARCPDPLSADAPLPLPPGEANRNQTCNFKGRLYVVGEAWEWSEGVGAGPQGVDRACDTCRCVVYPDRREMQVHWVCTSTCEPPPETTQQMPIWKMFAKLLEKVFSRRLYH